MRNQHMALRFVVNKRRGIYRLAVVVSKKVHKSAVKRNRVRRRLYEIVRLQSDNIKAPYDMVFTVFSDQIVDLPSEKLQEMVVGLLNQSNILSPDSTQGSKHPNMI